MFRRGTMVLGVLCLTFSDVAFLSAATLYTMTNLVLPGGFGSGASGINASGQVVGWSVTSGWTRARLPLQQWDDD